MPDPKEEKLDGKKKKAKVSESAVKSSSVQTHRVVDGKAVQIKGGK